MPLLTPETVAVTSGVPGQVVPGTNVTLSLVLRPPPPVVVKTILPPTNRSLVVLVVVNKVGGARIVNWPDE